MKKLYPLFLFISTLFLAQSMAEREAMIMKEMKSFSRLSSGYNVNPNTLNYDLKYQRLELDLDPAVYYVSGKVTSHFVPNQNISSIYFDVSNALTVSNVKYHGSDLGFTQLSSDEVKIDFPTSVSAGVTDSLSISYAGAPSSLNDAFTISVQNSTPVLYTLSEPYGAKDWFPTKQSLNDKIEKVDLKITSPSQYSVAGNGKLISETILPSGSKLTYWQTNYAIPAYLIGLGITNYTVINDTMGTPAFPFVNYLYPSTAANSTYLSNIAATKQFMDLYEQYFGPYPYRNEKYGHMEFSWGGGMEHATMSSMGSWGKAVICHELAHQWFGDKVTCGSWNDIWLNEGFATFGEHLTNEKLLMTNTDFLNYLQSQVNYITGSTAGSVYVSDAGLSNIYTVFDARLTYAKGGYLLRMIKWILGDSAFYQALKDYNSNSAFAYGYASSTDFKNSLLTSTGKDFTEFFNDWLYGQGYPTYNIKWNQGTDNTMVFKIAQTQSHASVSFFEMPLPIKVTGTGGEVAYLVLDNTSNNQLFTRSLNFAVSSVSFNYDYQIITKNATVTKDVTLLSTDEIVENAVKLYPNPVTSEVKFSGINTKQDYEIFSIDGKRVSKGSYIPHSSINVSALQKGIYFISINGNHYKFIKD